MLKKILSLVALGSLFVSSALADDVLAKVSKGALSDNSQGVKVLCLDEMKEVKGGYLVKLYRDSNYALDSKMYAVALYSAEEYLKGLCPAEQTTCDSHNEEMLGAYNIAVNQKYGEYGFFPVYIVKRQVKVSDLGLPYVVFTYKTGALDKNMQLYQFDSTTSGALLNNNSLIKDIARHHKENMESSLGGWIP